MATVLTPDQIADLVVYTLENFTSGKWKDISIPYQKYFYVSEFIQGERIGYEGGPKITWNIQYEGHNTTRATGAYDKDNYEVKPIGTKAEVPWAYTTTNYIYSLYEDAFNSGKGKILRYLMQRKHAMWMDYYNHMEERTWMAGSSSDAPRNPYGVPYWVTKNGLTSTFGFNGGNHTNWSNGPGGLDRSLQKYKGWKNAGATYTTFNDDDCLNKLSEAIDKCHFMSPDPYNEDAAGKPDYWLCTTFPVKRAAERLLKASNDNTGEDLGRWRGTPTFRSIPIRWIPVLSNTDSPAYDSSWPIYGLNMNSWECIYRPGWDKKLSKPHALYDSHTTFAVDLDDAKQFKMTDSRSNFVLYKD